MRKISLWITEQQHEKLLHLVTKGYFKDLSETVRAAINSFLREYED